MQRYEQRVACILLLATAGCASHMPAPETSAPAVQPQPAQQQAPGAQQQAAAAHPADVKFMQEMIGHHSQAIVMAALAPGNGASERVLRLAQKIDISQKDEIVMMRDWLTTRRQPLPDPAHAHHMQMPGMLTDTQMEQLKAARGAEFDRLFLIFMIQHHEGALVMVDALFSSPGAAQDSDIFRFASDVSADQQDEIEVMHRMLDMLAANREENR